MDRRDFLKGSVAVLFGLAVNPLKALEQTYSFSERRDPFRSLEERLHQLPQYPRIFVGNNGIAFFDVNNPPVEPTDVVKIKDLPAEIMYSEEHYCQIYNFYVKERETHYFTTNNYKGNLETVSVTAPCIVFCAYTIDKNGGVKSSGVYHAHSMPPKKFFKDRLYKLIDTVRSTHNEDIIMKGAGRSESEDLKKIKKDLEKILAEKGVKIKPEDLLLGGSKYRITEFHPKRGKLVTYFTDKERRTYYNLKII